MVRWGKGWEMDHWDRIYYCVVCKLALGGVLMCEQYSVAF